MGKIQRQDVKTEAELISAGANKTDLIRTDQIYDPTLGETLDDAIALGLLGGGGGGTTIAWHNDSIFASEEVTYNSLIKAFKFTKGESQKIQAAFKVPESHTAGQQLFMKLGIAGDVATNNVSASILIGLQGTGTILSPQATRTHTQDVTITATNKIYDATFQLTDNTGKVGAVTVQPNDIIYLRLETYDTNYNTTGSMFVFPTVSEVYK